jgi:hydroxymethylpyrimidine pyrophosphatase-like HAD family hydrolase
MPYNVLAVDYDGTLAQQGEVDQPTLEALVRWRETGRWLILVTGRRLEPLLEVFPQLDVFHLVVAENGGLIYRPGTAEEIPLADPPPGEFVETLRRRNVPLETGRVIVATRTPHDAVAFQVIRELGLDLAVIFNKGAVMILPSGVQKASGLEAALQQLHLSPANTVGIGDAENDEALLKLCGLAVAVGNALPAVKEIADVVTGAERGAGVAEWIHQHLAD